MNACLSELMKRKWDAVCLSFPAKAYGLFPQQVNFRSGWQVKHGLSRAHSGFTLAELLISLLIIGELATFTIPKIINAQQNSQNIAVVKEAASMVAEAYQVAQMNGQITTSSGIDSFTQYMNYVKFDTSTSIDDKQTQGTLTCSGSGALNCLKLHNGAMLRYGSASAYWFGGTNTTNALWFDIDPDGKVTDGTTNGPGKSVEFWIYYNGRITTVGNIASNTCYGVGTCLGPTQSYDQSWFNW